jgi:hypothetical protein
VSEEVPVVAARHRRNQILNLLKETGFRCCFCLCVLDQWSATREHMVPFAAGGKNHMSNQTVSCNECNMARGSKEFYAFEESTVKRPEHIAKPHPQKVRLMRKSWRVALAEGLK